MINFIGIGAQKSGTSWVYACLYEHPEICAPVKEIHFFSRPRYEKGVSWYEGHFKECSSQKKCGEFSTSYLYSEEAPARIHAHYPDTKLIAIVRNPLTRARSHYHNALKAGEISQEVTFEEFCRTQPSVLLQGKYYEQLMRYLSLFSKERILVLVYEDSKKDPEEFIKKIYSFLDVDVDFTPSMLHRSVNVARAPRLIVLDRMMHHISEWLRRAGFGRFVHMVRKVGITDMIRSINTQHPQNIPDPIDTDHLAAYFREDVEKLSALLQRDLIKEWNLV